MCSNDTKKCFEMVASEHTQQQSRQDQDYEGEVQNEAHHSKSRNNCSSIFQEKEIFRDQDEKDEGEIADPNRNHNSYCIEIESDSESMQSSDEDEDLAEDNLRDRGWVSEIPRVPQTCEIGPSNGLVLPTVELPSFGDVCVKNSNNVTLENRTFFKGPVTISTVVYSNSENKKDDDDEEKRDSLQSQSYGSDVPLNPDPDINKVKQWLITWRCAAIFSTIALMFVAMIVVMVLTSARYTTSPTLPIFPDIPDSSVDGDVWIHGVKFVSREEWLAQPPAQPLAKMSLPVKYVFISHTVSDFCYTQSECTKKVRLTQTYHIESNHWSDIAYSFLVGGDGLVYVGRSWDNEGAHTFNWNNISIGISFIGTFNDFIPPKNQLHAAQKLIELGVKEGKITEDYILLGHRQVAKTLSPGDALYKIIQTWPHWSPYPYGQNSTSSTTTND
ncbi:peptidoglycan-recognition protein LC-like [Belonocnema kinseyi]|uniref:peptidoglycan-recognition protein LC-like n=1 Tax=Belonocnema kinseyi TaxID=2817044 RepID=UPI00143D77D1|nr:peptidoglycan-recognition protein LC-like [Belonocnema kinseyi]